MHISTRTGDKGKTGLLNGIRVPKYHGAIEAVGTLDEAIAFLSLAKATSSDSSNKSLIQLAQKNLYVLGAELVTPLGRNRPKNMQISKKDVIRLEWALQKYGSVLEQPTGFIDFGESESSAYFDVARTIVRRLERKVVRMNDSGMINNPYALEYLNRLSDVLFVLACRESEVEIKKDRSYPYCVCSN